MSKSCLLTPLRTVEHRLSGGVEIPESLKSPVVVQVVLADDVLDGGVVNAGVVHHYSHHRHTARPQPPARCSNLL